MLLLSVVVGSGVNSLSNVRAFFKLDLRSEGNERVFIMFSLSMSGTTESYHCYCTNVSSALNPLGTKF